MIDLSIIIVSYRTPEILRVCLERLTADPSELSREIIVVDNDSRDESPAIARSFPGVTVLETGDNLGFAGGVNRGLAAAQGRFMAVLNPDIEVEPGALDGLVRFLEDHPETGIAAPKLLNTDGTLQHSCRRNYTLWTVLLRRTFLGRLFPNAAALRRHLMLDYDHATVRAVDWVAGAAMVVRREALDDVGPMDERYFLYFEDVDWCTRMQARGWLVHYVPQFRMTHHWQRASKAFGPAARRHLRAGLRFYDRWSGLLFVTRQYAGLWRGLGLAALDLLVVSAALLLAFLFRQQMAFLLEKPVWSLGFYQGFFAASVLVMMGAFAAQGLYRDTREGDWVDVAFRIAKGATLGALILMASTFVLDMRSYSRAMVLASWPLAAAGAFLNRRLVDRVFARTRRERWNLRRVALVGAEPVMDQLERSLRESPELGWEPVRMRRTPWLALPPGEQDASFLQQLARERITEVVLTPESLGVPEDGVAARLLQLRRAGHGVRLVSSFLASLPPRARVERVGEVSWLALERPRLQPAKLSKRVLDLVGALILGLAGVVPASLVALVRGVTGHKIWEPEQVWVGRWGEPHRVRRLAGGGWLASVPLLEQVLRGRFSLVGPRPLEPQETAPGGDGWCRIRELHRPGLVGPWTLFRSVSPEEEMQQELRYLEDWSPELDLKLLLRVALRRPGGGSGSGSSSTLEDSASPASVSATPPAHAMGIP